MNKNIQEINYQQIRWTNISQPDKKTTDYLKANFNFNPLDLEDILTDTQRSKIDKYSDYLFLVLLFPIYDRQTKSIKPSELNIFLGPDFLVTLHQGNLQPLTDLFSACAASAPARSQFFGKAPESLLYSILKKLFLDIYPMLDNLSLEISQVEEKIFQQQQLDTTSDIMNIRRNIVDFRQIMQAHKNTLSQIKKNHLEEDGFTINRRYYNHYDDLIDRTREIWDLLDNFKEAIETVRQTNETLISFRLNDIIKTLTIFSVFLMPSTLIGTLFGMNLKFLPIVNHPLGFLMILFICFFSSSLILVFLWKKRWL